MANRIANPIYDSVFKFMMEDERVARTDEDVRYIFNRLAYAAANPDVRHMMDMEDEILGELEDLDTTIARQKEQLLQKDEQLSQQKEQLSAMQEELEQQRKLLSQK